MSRMKETKVTADLSVAHDWLFYCDTWRQSDDSLFEVTPPCFEFGFSSQVIRESTPPLGLVREHYHD